MSLSMVGLLCISLSKWIVRSILQRVCSIATGIPHARIRTKNLGVTEWEKVAEWWANRFQEGQEKVTRIQKTSRI